MNPARRRCLGLLPALALAAGAARGQAKLGADFGVLVGRWVRPDGGYVIEIKAVDAAGKLDASYANPSPLPFYTAEAQREGSSFKLFFDLRAGGYNGSTYRLVYDPVSDQLKGVYHQAVANQKFEVAFARTK